jgi:hypothetical protein
MHWRVYAFGLIAGILLTVVVRYPLYQYLPSLVVAEWDHTAQSAPAMGLAVVALLTLAGIGAVAARLSGVGSRFEAASAGAAAGLIATLVAEVWFGAPTAGLWGAREWLGLPAEPLNNSQLLSGYVAEAAGAIHWWTYLSAVMAIGAGLGFGALGGALAGPGGLPALGYTMLGPTLSFIGMFTTALSAVISVVIFAFLGPAVENAAQKGLRLLSYPANSILLWPVLFTLGVFVMWQLAGWWAAYHARPLTVGEYRATRIIIWVNGLLPLALMGALGFLNPAFFSWWLGVAIGLGLVILGFLNLTALRRLGLPPDTNRTPLSSSYLALVIALSGAVLFIIPYLSFGASGINLILLVTGPLPVIGAEHAAQLAEALAKHSSNVELMQALFIVHQNLAMLAASVIFIFAAFAGGVVSVAEWFERRAKR